MKKTKFLLKAIAFSLAVIAVFQVLPLSTIATELNNSDIEEIATAQAAEKYLPEIIGEEKTLRMNTQSIFAVKTALLSQQYIVSPFII